MKGSRETKRHIAIERMYQGKKNGVVRWLFDNPKLEIKMAKNKRLRNRKEDRKVIENDMRCD